MIAGTGSGCGKTTITCALLAALSSMGKTVVSFKCGPDYIDPMFHKKATGVESRNLDIFLMGEQGVKNCLTHHSADREIAVLEGVMGFYDGLGSGSYASSSHVSLLTNTPVILIVNAKGVSLSLCAMIKGFIEFEKNNIQGVILNNVSESLFLLCKPMIEERLNIRVVGFMPHIPEAEIESRHLGLITADEIANIKGKINILGKYASKHIDINVLLHIAGQAEPPDLLQNFSHGDTEAQIETKIIQRTPEPPCRCAFVGDYFSANTTNLYIASDEAFCFWYEDNHDFFRALGAEIKFFSPIHDEELPGDAGGLVLWGGYPELYGEELEKNAGMKFSITSAISAGLPVYAECGGFIYLQQSMTDLQGNTYGMLGVLPGKTRMTNKLQNFGYCEMEAVRDNLLCKNGEEINAHFFRYSISDNEGDCFNAKKRNGQMFPCVVSEKNIFAGYQHLHFCGNPAFAENFMGACAVYMRDKK